MTGGAATGQGAPSAVGGARPLRILVVNWQDRLNPHAGGAEVHLHEVFGRLASRGHEVTLLASAWPAAPARERVDGLDVHRVGSRFTFGTAAPAYYARHLRPIHFDVLVEDLNKFPLLTPWWPGRPPAVLLVHHLFGAAAFASTNPALAAATWLAERLLPVAYRGIPAQAVSASTAAELVRCGLRARDIHVIHNGVDTGFLAPDAGTPRAAAPTLVYVGRLRRYKRVDVIVRALARLARAGLQAHLVVAGAGPEAPALRRLAAALGVQDAVHFAGFVDENEKRRLLRTAWAHVTASTKEGWGLTVLEAGACGTTTVATDVPGLRDSVVHRRTGLLVPAGDAAALADALGALLADREAVEALGRAALDYATLHTWERAAGETEAHLRAVADGRLAAMPIGLRQRHPTSHVPLPRTGVGPRPFGAVTLVATREGRGALAPLTLRGALGAEDPDGRSPTLVLAGLPPELRAELRPPADVVQVTPDDCAQCVVWRLYGWPDDPGAWLAQSLSASLPGDWSAGAVPSEVSG